MIADKINSKSLLLSFGCAVVALGMSLPFANSAHAKSTGCASGDLNSTSNRLFFNTGGLVFAKGERIAITVTGPAAGVNITEIRYTDNNNAANNLGGADGTSLSVGQTKTTNFTIPADTTSGAIYIQLNATSSVTTSCLDPLPTSNNSSNENNSGTKSAVVSAVSRSQTTVIQQNIGSRVSTVTGAAGGSGAANTGTGNTGPAGTNTSGTENTNLVDMRLNDRQNSITDRDDALRRIAMMGSFDSSTGKGMQMLGLGPTDQGDVGGASGIDGRSAFATTTPFTVWGHGSFTSVDNDHVNGTSDDRYDGDVWGYNIGLDYRFADALIAGLSLGYNDTDLTTSFNNGSYQETGWVASPYVIYRPMENLTISGEAGYGMGDIDVTRNNGAVSGNTESDMWYAALTTSYLVRPVETLPVSLTPSLAFLAARKTVDAYRESDGTNNATTRSNTRQIKPAIEAAYDFTPTQSLTVSPFVETGLIYDFTDEINNDKTAFNIGGGVRLSDRLTGLNAALEGNYLAGRADYTEYTIGGTVTYGFTLTGDDGRSLGVVTPFFASNLNEYGNQRIRTGFGFDTGGMTSQLAFSHMMSVADDDEDDDTDTSRIEVSMSVPF